MILSKLIQHIRPIKVVGNVEREITGVNIDSRKIENNHLFIAIKGTQVDGRTSGHNVLWRTFKETKVGGCNWYQWKDYNCHFIVSSI